MEKDKNIEDKLLAQNSIEQLIAKKVEQEVKQELKSSKKVLKKCIEKDFTSVPKDMIFSSKCAYLAFNTKTKSEGYINGVQADSIVGLKKSVRKDLLEQKIDSFSNGDYYVKFASYCYFK